MSKLFTVPVSTGGSFECTSPADKVYLLTFISPPDNRITVPFLTSFILSLNIIEHKFPRGVVITTSAAPKFYSNGYDLEHTLSTPRFMEDWMLPLLRRLLTYPMPTIALVNGHTFGAGVFLAMAHDYRIQNPSKGFVCLPEIDMGITIPTSTAVMLKYKIGSPTVYRTAALEGKRLSGQDTLKLGLVDGLGALEEVLQLISTRNLLKKSAMGSFGGIKEDAHSEILAAFEKEQENQEWRREIDRKNEERGKAFAKQVEEWERGSKL